MRLSLYSKWKLTGCMIAATLCAAPLLAQSSWQPGHEGIGFGRSHGHQWVQMISSPTVVITSRGHASDNGELALRFTIDTGLHINSHAPHSKFLIPTTLKFSPEPGVQVSEIQYPPGVDYHLAFDPKDLLNVYTEEFGLLIQLRARPGQYVLHGSLRYQACDNRACNPPKTLPVTLNLTAK